MEGEEAATPLDSFVKECAMGLPELTRLLTAAYTCAVAFTGGGGGGIGGDSGGGGGELAVSPERSAFLTSVEAVETYR